MFTQYTTEHNTELGKMTIERTYKEGILDAIIVVVAHKVLELPKHMWRTDTTIVRKACQIVKGQLDALQIDNINRSLRGELIGE